MRSHEESTKCKMFDVDGDGYILLDSLQDYFAQEDSVHILMKSVDEDKDGMITQEQCLSVMQTVGYRLPGLKVDKSQTCDVYVNIPLKEKGYAYA